MEEILRLTMEIVATGVGVLLLILIKRAAKKYGFELKGAEESNLLAVMTRIVFHVEEEAAKSFKLTSQKWDSWRKFNEAFRLFAEEVPGHTEKKVTQLVDQVLVNNSLGATVNDPKCWPEVAGKPPGSIVNVNIPPGLSEEEIASKIKSGVNKALAGQPNAKAGEKVVIKDDDGG